MTDGRSIGTQPYAALAVDIYVEKLNAGKPLHKVADVGPGGTSDLMVRLSQTA